MSVKLPAQFRIALTGLVTLFFVLDVGQPFPGKPARHGKSDGKAQENRHRRAWGVLPVFNEIAFAHKYMSAISGGQRHLRKRLRRALRTFDCEFYVDVFRAERTPRPTEELIERGKCEGKIDDEKSQERD